MSSAVNNQSNMPEEFVSNHREIFKSAVLRALKLRQVRDVVTVPYNPGTDTQEYSEYFNCKYRDADKASERLGFAVGILYNALVGNAAYGGKKVVTDLFAGDNLKFNIVYNAGVGDNPADDTPGWVSFRFHFESSDKVPASLSLSSPGFTETLAKAAA